MGISRDNWHKRRKTGGKRKPYHKKWKYELGRPAANTKIGPHRIHTVCVRGDCCTRKTRIIDVVYNASNNGLVRTKTLVKNCMVLIDSTPYRQWYQSHYALPLGRKKGKKYDERKKNAKISSLLEEFQQGKLLACIASRPGQGGRADGYVLEEYLYSINVRTGYNLSSNLSLFTILLNISQNLYDVKSQTSISFYLCKIYIYPKK
uniref:Small ribosomal subunit protein eS8 n=1 Tax=Mandrillus leucophaeus TaxID=9568 RepID=A0A2K5XDD9_MANLE